VRFLTKHGCTLCRNCSSWYIAHEVQTHSVTHYLFVCVHLARPTCIHCITLQRTWNQAIFCTWVLRFVTWWLGCAGARTIVTWLRIGTGWTTCTGQSRTTNGWRPTHVKTTLCNIKDCIFVCDIGVLSVGTAHITSSVVFLTLCLLSYPIQLLCTNLDRTAWSNRESYGFWRLSEGSLFRVSVVCGPRYCHDCRDSNLI
jgi:hypothetical protein